MKETSIVISPPATDPKADYPVYKVFLTGETSIEGDKQSLDELERLDNVKVWIDEINEAKEFAGRIVVAD